MRKGKFSIFTGLLLSVCLLPVSVPSVFAEETEQKAPVVYDSGTGYIAEKIRTRMS